MLLKLLGSLIIVITSSWIGFIIAGYYRERPKQLRDFQSALQMLQTEIIYGSTPIPEALSRIAKKTNMPVSTFFQNVKEILYNYRGYTVDEAWEIALKNLHRESSLNKTDKEILSVLGNYLGISDKQDQIKHLKLTSSYLKKQEENAEEERKKNEKMWKYLGVLTGLMIILLIY